MDKQLEKLTIELWSLIFGVKVLSKPEIGEGLCEGYIFVEKIEKGKMKKENIDTIGRLCEDLLIKLGYKITINLYNNRVAVAISSSSGATYSTTVQATTTYCKTALIFTVVYHAAKEKGLLK